MYNFWKARPLRFGRAKKRPNFGAISNNFRLWSRISPKRMGISKIWKVVDQLQPNTIRHNISALKGCCALTFWHCRERNFDYLNWFCTRNCGAGRPHVGLCPAHLVDAVMTYTPMASFCISLDTVKYILRLSLRPVCDVLVLYIVFTVYSSPERSYISDNFALISWSVGNNNAMNASPAVQRMSENRLPVSEAVRHSPWLCKGDIRFSTFREKIRQGN